MCTYLCQIEFFPNLLLHMANFYKIPGLVAVANTMFEAAFLYQLCDSIQLDSESVPDDKNCGYGHQQWHVPSESGNVGVIFFSELSF